MLDWPGWNSLDTVSRIHSLAELGGIILLGLLVAAEFVTFKYSGRKDVPTEQQQTAEKQRHDDEMTRLHFETAQAKERAANAELELFKLKAPRTLDDAAFKSEIAGKPKWPIVEFWLVDASDCRFFAMQIAVALTQAGWIVPVPKALPGPNSASEFAAYQSPIESRGALPTGVSVVTKAIEDDSPQASLMGALSKALPGWQVNGGRDSSMRESTIRIVVAPRM